MLRTKPDTGNAHTPDEWERAARADGWTHRFSHFTKHGTSVAYVDCRTLCLCEGIARAEGRTP